MDESGIQTKGPNGEGSPPPPVVLMLVLVRWSRVGMVEDGDSEAVAVVEVGAGSAAAAPRLAAAAATAARRELVFFRVLFFFLCFCFFGSPLASISTCALSPAPTPPPRTLACAGAIIMAQLKLIERPLSCLTEFTGTG